MTMANHDRLGSRCEAHIEQLARTAYCSPASFLRPCRRVDLIGPELTLAGMVNAAMRLHLSGCP